MAEAVGVIASGITLAALFKTSVEVFKLIQAAEHHDRDLKKLITKLRLHGCRLFEWGKYISIVSDAIDSETECLPIHPFRQTIKDALTEIITLFHDAKQLRERYGCKESDADQQEATELSVLNSTIKLPQQAEAESSRLMRAIGRTRWAIKDRRRFVLFIVEINDLVDALCKATESIAPQRAQTRGLTSRFSTVNNADTLDLVSEACEQECPALARMAADRSEMLTLGTTARWRLERWELETKMDRDRMMLQTETRAVADELEQSRAGFSSLSMAIGADIRVNLDHFDAVENGNFDRHLEEEAAIDLEQTKKELQWLKKENTRLKEDKTKLLTTINEMRDILHPSKETVEKLHLAEAAKEKRSDSRLKEPFPPPPSLRGNWQANKAATFIPESKSAEDRTSNLPQTKPIFTAPSKPWAWRPPTKTDRNEEANKLQTQIENLQAELANRRRASEPTSSICCENLNMALFAALAWSYGARWESETIIVGESFCVNPPYQPKDVVLLPGKKGNLDRAKHFVSMKRRQVMELAEWSKSQRLAGHVYLEAILPRYSITTAVLPVSNSCVGRDTMQACYACGERYSIWAYRNEFICECGATFCVECGQQWKTCACPNFCEDLEDRRIWKPKPIALPAPPAPLPAMEVGSSPWDGGQGPLWLQRRQNGERLYQGSTDSRGFARLTASDLASQVPDSLPLQIAEAAARSPMDDDSSKSHNVGDAAPAA